VTNWDVYVQAKSFTLIEAAFLWLEIEPTKDQIIDLPYLQADLSSSIERLRYQEVGMPEEGEIPYEVIKMRDSLAEELRKQGVESFRNLAKWWQEENNIPTFAQAFDQFIVASAEHLQPLGEAEMAKRVEAITGEERRLYIWGITAKIQRVSREDLLEIAKRWGEQPKFLFGETMGGKNSEKPENFPNSPSNANLIPVIQRVAAELLGECPRLNENNRGGLIQKLSELLTAAPLDIGGGKGGALFRERFPSVGITARAASDLIREIRAFRDR
jgi:hypothetical protein